MSENVSDEEAESVVADQSVEESDNAGMAESPSPTPTEAPTPTPTEDSTPTKIPTPTPTQTEDQDEYKELDLSEYVGEWADATYSTFASITTKNGKLYIVISSVMDMGREQWSWEYDDCGVMDGEGIEAIGTYTYYSYSDSIGDWAIVEQYETSALLSTKNGELQWNDLSGWSCVLYRD